MMTNLSGTNLNNGCAVGSKSEGRESPSNAFAAMPKYDVYKDSGVDWLGKIPEHWSAERIKSVGSIVNGATPSSGVSYYWDGDLVWAAPTDINKIKYLYDSARKLTKRGYESCGTALVPAGSVVLTCRAPIGKVVIAGVELCTNQGCKSVVLKEGVENRFIYYALSITADKLNSLGTGTTFLELSSGALKNFRFPLPSFVEQISIANFLDQKTAQIDEAISIKEKQISLLKERKQIIIQKAVTQGLNPDVPMKDSGVEWIGQIPEHWEVKRLKYLGNAIIGLTYSPNDLCDEMDGTLVARSSNLFEGKFKYGEKENVYVRCKIPERLILKKGDVLICSRNGSRDLIGKCAFVTSVDEGNSFGAFTTVFRSKLNDYLFCILNSDIFKMLSGSFLTSTINQLTVGNLNGIYVPIPPDNERIQIRNYIGEINISISDAIAIQSNQIVRLKEYKATLINSAVTGKIKVA